MKRRFELMQSASDAKALELYIYGDIERGYWGDAETSSNHIRKCLEEHKGAEHITVYINSLGGDAVEGVAIGNLLKRNPAEVTAVIDGFACSAASVIACCADKVVMPKNAIMMIHNMWTVVAGNANQLRKVADDLDVLMQANRTTYLEKAGDKLTEEQLIELLDAETYLTAEQAMEIGLCDEIREAVVVDESIIDDNGQTMQEAADMISRLKAINEVVQKAIDEPEEAAAEEEESAEEMQEEVRQKTGYLDRFLN